MKYIYTFLLLLFVTSLYAQIAITAKPGNYHRKIPIMGITGNAMYKNTWNNQSLVDSFKNLNPSIIRYPGGTPSNYWDWKKGWVTTPFSSCYTNGPNPALTVRFEELKLGLDACNATMLYTLNLLNSSLDYQLKGLKHADSLGIGIKYIEMGNEHNLSCDPISASQYASTCQTWCDSIKKVYPNSKICLVGGDLPNSNPNWISSIKNQNITFDALAYHIYPLAANTALNTSDMFSKAYQVTGSRYNLSHFGNMSNKEVWVTEYNMSAANTGAANTWTQTLFLMAMFDTLMQIPQITMMLPWAYSGQPNYLQALDYNNFSMKATGVYTKLIDDITEGMDSCERMEINAPLQFANGIYFPSVFGYKLYHDTTERFLYINLSNRAFELDFSLLGQSIDFVQYTADTSKSVNNGFADLQVQKNKAMKKFTVPPFSVTTASTYISANLSTTYNDMPTFTVYPNPTNNSCTLSSDHPIKSYRLYDTMGQLLYVGSGIQVDCSSMADGVYLIVAEFKDGSKGYQKLIKQ